MNNSIAVLAAMLSAAKRHHKATHTAHKKTRKHSHPRAASVAPSA